MRFRPFADTTNNDATNNTGIYDASNQGVDVARHSSSSRSDDVTAAFSSTEQIPYRGAEPHGVEMPDYSATFHDSPQEWNGEPGTDNTPHSPTTLPPIDVRIVENHAPTPALRREFRTRNFPLAFGTDNGVSRLVVGRNDVRTSLKITLKSLDGTANLGRVWVGGDSLVGPNNGLPLDSADTFTTTTTEDVWFMLDPAATYGTLLCIVQEYDVKIETS